MEWLVSQAGLVLVLPAEIYLDLVFPYRLELEEIRLESTSDLLEFAGNYVSMYRHQELELSRMVRQPMLARLLRFHCRCIDNRLFLRKQ